MAIVSHSQCMRKELWFSKCGPRTSSICTTWELIRNANFQAPSQTTESEALEMGTRNLVFNKLSRLFWCTLQFENHWCSAVFSSFLSDNCLCSSITFKCALSQNLPGHASVLAV